MVGFYRPLLGNEAYGLVGFSIAIGLVISFVTSALEPVLVREVALRDARKESLANLIRGQEYIFWTLAVLLITLSGVLASATVKPLVMVELDRSVATQAIQLMLVSVALDLASRLYTAVLTGRQEHHLAAALMALRSWAEALGGYIVLRLTGDILSFFWCYLAVRALVLIISAFLSWRPVLDQIWVFRVGRDAFKGLGRFAMLNLIAAGCTCIYVFGLQQILGMTVGLGILGIYNLAMIPAAAAGNLAGNVRISLLPRLCELGETKSETEAYGSYFKGVELLALIATPVLVCIALLPESLFMIWQQGDLSIMPLLIPVGATLAASSIFITMTHMVSQLEFTKGRLQQLLIWRALPIVVLLPIAWYFAPRYGILGIARAHLVFAIAECFIMGFFCYRNYGDRQNYASWAVKGILLPTAICSAVAMSILCVAPWVNLTIGLSQMEGWPGMIVATWAPVLMLAISFPLVAISSPFIRESLLSIARRSRILPPGTPAN